MILKEINRKDSKSKMQISQGGITRPRLPGLVKHDDSDTAQRGSQVHALIKYVARQVSSILTSLDAFTLHRFLLLWCNYIIAIVPALQLSTYILFSNQLTRCWSHCSAEKLWQPWIRTCLTKWLRTENKFLRDNFNKACWGFENNCW